MAEEDFDLYNDLDDFQVVEEKKAKELQEADNKNNELTKIIEDLRAEIKTKDKEIKKMHTNFQILLDTAMAETKRKDQVINDLRRQVDDICFRRRKFPNKQGHHQNNQFVDSQMEDNPMPQRGVNPFKNLQNRNDHMETEVVENSESATNIEYPMEIPERNAFNNRLQPNEDNERSRGDKYYNKGPNNQRANNFRDRSRGQSSGRTLHNDDRGGGRFQAEREDLHQHGWHTNHQREEFVINENSSKHHPKEDRSHGKSTGHRHGGEGKDRDHKRPRSGSNDRWHSTDHPRKGSNSRDPFHTSHDPSMKRSKSRERTHNSNKRDKHSHHRSFSRDRHKEDRQGGNSTDRAKKDDGTKSKKQQKESKSHTEEQQTATNHQRNDLSSNHASEEHPKHIPEHFEEQAQVANAGVPVEPCIPWLAERKRGNRDITLEVLHYDTTTPHEQPQQQENQSTIKKIAKQPIGIEEYRQRNAKTKTEPKPMLTPNKMRVYNNLIAQPELLSNVMQLIGRKSPPHPKMDKIESMEGERLPETNRQTDDRATTVSSDFIETVEGEKTENKESREVAAREEKRQNDDIEENTKPTEEILEATETIEEQKENQEEQAEALSEAILAVTEDFRKEALNNEERKGKEQVEELKTTPQSDIEETKENVTNCEDPRVEKGKDVELKESTSEKTPQDKSKHEALQTLKVKDIENDEKKHEENAINDKSDVEKSQQNDQVNQPPNESIYKTPTEQSTTKETPEETTGTLPKKRQISEDEDNDIANEIRRPNKKKRHFMNVIKDDSDEECVTKHKENCKKLREMPREEPEKMAENTVPVGPSQLSTPRKEKNFNEIDRRLNEMFTSLVPPVCPHAKLKTTTMITEETPSSSQETVSSFLDTTQHEDMPTTDVTINETVENVTAVNGTVNESLNTSGEIKHISLGSKDYRFEKVDENVVKLVITRKRGKKLRTNLNAT